MAARVHLLTVRSPTRGEHSSRDREAPTTAAAMAQQSASLTRQMACRKHTKLHPSKCMGGWKHRSPSESWVSKLLSGEQARVAAGAVLRVASLF